MPQIHSTSNPDENPSVLTERVKPVNDILDWLSSIFGFQVTFILEALVTMEFLLVLLIVASGGNLALISISLEGV